MKEKRKDVLWGGMSYCVLERLLGLGVQWSKFSSLLRAVDTLLQNNKQTEFSIQFQGFHGPPDAHPWASMDYSLGIIIVIVTLVTPFEAYYTAATILSTLFGLLSSDCSTGR